MASTALKTASEYLINVTGGHRSVVGTENLDSDVVVMKFAKDWI